MHKKTLRAVSVAMAVTAAISAVFSLPTMAYEYMLPSVTPETGTEDEAEDGENSIFINLLSAGGKVVIDEGEDWERKILLESDENEEVHINVYDGEDELVSQNECDEDGKYVFEYVVDSEDAVNIKTIADEDYVVWKYDVAEEGVSEETGFRREGLLEEFEYPVTVDADKDFYVRFVRRNIAESIIREEEESETPEEDPEIKPGPDDLSVGEGDDIDINGDDTDVDEGDIGINDPETDDDINVNDDLTLPNGDVSVNTGGADDGDVSVETETPEDSENPEAAPEEEDPGKEEAEPEETVPDETDPGEDVPDVTDPGQDLIPDDSDVSVLPSDGDVTVPDEEDPEIQDPETEVPDDSEIPDVEITSEPENPDVDIEEDPEMNPEEDPEQIPEEDLEENPEENLEEDLEEDPESDPEENIGDDSEDPESDGEEEVIPPEVHKEMFTASVSVLDGEAVTVGEKATLLVNAQNTSEVPAQLFLYFCETEDGLTEDTSLWDVYLNRPAMSVVSEELEAGLPVTALLSDGTAADATLHMSGKLEEGQIVSRFASMELPAESTADFALTLSSEVTETVSVIPVIEYGEEESVYGIASSVTWQEKEEPAAPEHFLEHMAGIEIFDAQLFSTARLVVLADSEDVIIDPEHLISSYGNIYLLQYGSVEQAMNAYMYYLATATAVEPDMAMNIAGDVSVLGGDEDVSVSNGNEQNVTEESEAEESGTGDVIPEEAEPEVSEETVTEEPDGTVTKTEENGSADVTAPQEIEGISVTVDNNPIALLSDEDASVEAQEVNKVIALIDTGASAGPNIIDRVSLIDDVLNGGTHGDDMVKFITEENPGARILSIRALGNDGYGSYSAVVSAVEYAINSQVDIINLSMYSERSLATSVLEIEIQKAIDTGITVVGSAGNDGKNVEGYVPGAVRDVWTIGSADSEGVRNAISNFGDLVDFYVVSESTSEAAARFSGYISLFGLSAAVDDHTGLIFGEVKDVYENNDVDVNTDRFDTTRTDDTIFDPVIENYVKDNADPEYVGEGELGISNSLDVYAMLASEKDLVSGDTISAVSRDARFLMQHLGRVPVYQLSPESSYYVAYADVMHNDRRARIVDYLITENNVDGILIDGCYFDEETGLLYIPKETFYGEDGSYILGKLKFQVLYGLSKYDINKQWNSSTVAVTENENSTINSDIEGDNVLEQFMTIQVGKHMDLDTMMVSVNGFPIDGKNYAYDPECGLLSMGFSSALVQSVWVQAEKSADAPDLEPGMRAAYGSGKGSSTSVNFEGMQAIAADMAPADFDKLSVGYGIRTSAKVYYGGTQSFEDHPYSGESCGGSIIYAYEPTDIDKMQNWMVKGSGAPPIGEVVGATTVYHVYPFALSINSIGGAEVDFSIFPADLNMIMACSDASNELGGNVNGWNDWSTVNVQLRVMAIDKDADQPWVVFAIYTQQIAQQNGCGVFKVYLEKSGGGQVRICKYISEKNFVDYSDRIKVECEFTIYKDKACTQVFTGYSKYPDGKIKISTEEGNYRKTVTLEDFPVGIYYMKETVQCGGCIKNTTTYQFKVDKDKTTTKFKDLTTKEDVETIPNQPFIWKFNIKKVDPSGNGLEGAVFRVSYYAHERKDKDTDPALKIWYFKSDSKGEVLYDKAHFLEEWTNPKTGKTVKSNEPILTTNKNGEFTKEGEYYMPIGHIYVKEVQAPPGYKKVKEFHMTANPESISQSNPVCHSAVEPHLVKEKIITDEWMVSLKVKKIKEDKSALEGAEFEVWSDAQCHEELLATLVSDASGETEIYTYEEIPGDEDEFTLYVRESKAPEGFSLTGEIYKVTFKKSDFDALGDPEKNSTGQVKVVGVDLEDGSKGDGVVNKPGWPVRVQVKKVDEDGNLVKGAKFGIYTNPLCTPESKVGEVTTTDTGSTEFSMGVSEEKDEFYLYCKEIEAPEGYTLNSKVFGVKFTKAEYEAMSDPAEKLKGLLKTFGVDNADGGTGGEGIVNKKGWPVRVQVKKVDESGQGLAGAEFDIFSDPECTDLLGTVTSQAPDGLTEEFSVPVSENESEIILYCKEKTAPPGCELLDEVFSVTFTRDEYEALGDPDKVKGVLKLFGGDEGIENKTTTSVTPTPTPPDNQGGVFVHKFTTASDEIMELQGYDLAGAEYTVYEVQDDGTEVAIGTLVTDENGITNQLPLPDKSVTAGHPVTTTYKVRETKAPKGHKLNNFTEVFSVVSPYENDKVIELHFTNEPYFCDKQFSIEKLGAKGEPIEGAVFKVEFFDSDGPDPDKLKKTWYLESDENGMVYMDNAHLSTRPEYHSDTFYMHGNEIVIPIEGFLQVTEVQVQAEYVLNKDVYTFNTDVGTEFATRIYNQPEECRIHVVKYGEDGVTPLKGIEFELKFLKPAVELTDKKDANFKRLLEPGDTIVGGTDENGEIIFENLDQGTYLLTELKTAAGQSLLKEPLTFTIPLKMTQAEAEAYGNVDFGSAKEDEGYTDLWFFFECTFGITNTPVLHLPTTGDTGSWKYGFIGLGILGVIAVWFVLYGPKGKKRNKMRI